MKEFVKMAGAVTVGTLVASGLAVSLMLNKKILKVYTKKVMEISNDVTKEVMEDMFED